MSAPYLGDYVAGETVYFMWNSNGSNGASITRSTDGTISVYKDNNTTQTTTGVTDTENFDGLTGVHHCAVATSDAFYTAGTDFMVVLSAATIDTQTVNAVLAHFSIENRSALRPTTAGRTLDVSAGGEAGVDWANVGSPTTAVNLSATNIDTDQVVASVAGAVGSVTGNVGGNVTGSVGSVAAGGIAAASFAAGAIDATAIADNAIDAGAIAANAITAAKIADGAIDAATFAAGAINAAATAADFLAEVNAEVVDALATDTYAETTGVPAATAALSTKLGFVYEALRNKVTITSSKKTFYDDADAAQWEKDLSDDGSTYTETEGNAI